MLSVVPSQLLSGKVRVPALQSADITLSTSQVRQPSSVQPGHAVGDDGGDGGDGGDDSEHCGDVCVAVPLL